MTGEASMPPVEPIPMAMTPPRFSRDLLSLQEQMAALRAQMDGRTRVTEPTPADQVLAKAIELQTEAISMALKSKETRHSTIKVSPAQRSA